MKRNLFAQAAIALGLSGIVFGGTGCVNREAQAQAKKTGELVSNPIHTVSVQPVGTETLFENVDVTGSMTANQDSTIASKVSGRVTAVYVKDGETVTPGQLLATIETVLPMAQLQQAQAQVSQASAAVLSAQAALSQSIKNAQYGPSRSSSVLDGAKAQLKSAQSNLTKLIRGARPEERSQAEWAVRNAKSNLDTQTKELERIKQLVEEGAVAKNRLDQQESTFAAAQANYNNALDGQKILTNGTRQEDLDAARSAVRVAQETVVNAKSGKDLDGLLLDQVSAARAQVDSAKAQVETAKAQVEIAKQNLADTQIRAPFGGRVSGRPLQVGVIAGAGTPVARVVGSDGVYFDGQVPSEAVRKVAVGMPVTLDVDAIPGKAFSGKVAALSPVGDAIGRLFTARIQIGGSTQGLTAGMFARAQIRVRTIPGASVVPAGAVISRGDERFVFVAEGGVAHKTPVNLGLTGSQTIQVSGLAPGALVVVQGQQGLVDGAKIKSEQGNTQASKPGLSLALGAQG